MDMFSVHCKRCKRPAGFGKYQPIGRRRIDISFGILDDPCPLVHEDQSDDEEEGESSLGSRVFKKREEMTLVRIAFPPLYSIDTFPQDLRKNQKGYPKGSGERPVTPGVLAAMASFAKAGIL